MPEGSRHRHRKAPKPGWAGLRSDLSASLRRFRHGTSVDHKRFVIAVVALGAVLRVLRLNGPVTYDEALTYVHYADRSFGFLFSDLGIAGNHILYTALARASTLIFGAHAWALRLPAFLAGMLVLPLFYSFSRAVFNRHIAVIVLCLVSVGGPFVEYSALARGYSLSWLFLVCGLLAARHFVKTDNTWSAVLLALACSLGMLATPDMIYPALMCIAWAALMVVMRYRSTARMRLMKLAAASMMALVLCFLMYLPVIIRHSLDQLLNPPSEVENTWAHFMDTHQDRVFDVWAYFSDSASTFLAFAGAVAVIYAAYTSLKYRLLVFAFLFTAVPLVLLMRVVAPPAVWIYSLYVLNLGVAIGLFYLMKLVRDKVLPGFSKANRTLVASAFVLLAFGWFGLKAEGDPVERFPEAMPAAEWILKNTHSGDRVCASMPWDAPIDFELRSLGGDANLLKDGPLGSGFVYVVVGPGQGQTPEGVMADAGILAADTLKLHQVAGWRRLEMFSDR
ncbi:MAG: glycosyltransferase family 39 protein [Bacteroidetes bacterium]|nr:glycosyltransferase family 39 protein [Bacteroidota bacterium]MBS1941967.1 glycosyltransferase family 39 protein [Bacteroidota bacterium]